MRLVIALRRSSPWKAGMVSRAAAKCRSGRGGTLVIMPKWLRREYEAIIVYSLPPKVDLVVNDYWSKN